MNFDQLTPTEQELWNKFEKSDIYKFLTSGKDTLPKFCHNWVTFSAKPTVHIDTLSIAAKLFPVPQNQILRGVPRAYSASAPASPAQTL